MPAKVEKLTKSSDKDHYIELEVDVSKRSSRDLSGEHEAEIVSFSAEWAGDGRPYRAGVRLLSEESNSELIHGPVWEGGGLTRFLRALGLDLEKVGNRLRKGDVIGKRVKVTVEQEEFEGTFGKTEKQWVIKKFAPLA